MPHRSSTRIVGQPSVLINRGARTTRPARRARATGGALTRGLRRVRNRDAAIFPTDGTPLQLPRTQRRITRRGRTA